MKSYGILTLICALTAAAPTTALEKTVALDELLGFYDESQIRSVELDLGLPADAVIENVVLHLSGTANNGLYYDAGDPEQIHIPYWGDFTPYFPDTDPYVYGSVEASPLYWAGPVAWGALGGDVHWDFLDDSVQHMGVQFVSPYFVGFPVIVNRPSAVVSTASLTVTYQSSVGDEPTSWSAVKALWR